MPMVAFWQDVHKRYGQTAALAGFSLRLYQGQVLALLGANGAGKTTAIRSMLGLTSCDAGEIAVFGAEAGSRAARAAIGVMLQQGQLAPMLTGHELLCAHAALYPQPEAITQLIADLDLGGFVGQRYGQMSGGQQRRIQFALSLVGRPRLLLLDEPTGALDPLARAGFWDSVSARVGAGLSVLLTTHDVHEAEQVASHIAIVRGGRVVERGALADWQRDGWCEIRVRSALAPEHLRTLPGVSDVQAEAEVQRVLSQDGNAALRALLASDPGAEIRQFQAMRLSERLRRHYHNEEMA
ncbi:MAG: ABC transporter ATP-binding protein [Xanthomonadales bacterium]|nr:ABC transporter ATP-binding protein [Xanthomonadales bacterium]MCB1612398.1 ABC transporter ATP-binding protein [Xanthomonadales bacterium]MCP5476470.1 ABC transporter ATP-binding protein [Rhodanobacteraceae bacterium]